MAAKRPDFVRECRGRDSNPHAGRSPHLVLSQARMSSFATPARRRIALRGFAYSPPKLYETGMFFGRLPITIAISWWRLRTSALGSPGYAAPFTYIVHGTLGLQ